MSVSSRSRDAADRLAAGVRANARNVRVRAWITVPLLLLMATPSHAQSADAASFRKTYEPYNNVCSVLAIRPRYRATGEIPETCVPVYSDSELGHSTGMFLSAENTIPNGAAKDPLVTAGGSALVFRRQDQTDPPPACATPCFDYTTDYASMATCWYAAAPVGVRGVESGLSLAADVRRMNAAAKAFRPNGPPPVTMLSVRFDIVSWPEMQVSGFDVAWLAAGTTSWDAWIAWLSPWTWRWSDRGEYARWYDHDVGVRLNDLIALRGGDPQAAAYYLTRPHDPKYVTPNGAVVRQDNPDYQRWKIEKIVKPLLAESGASMVFLNHKYYQYDPGGSHGRNGSQYCGDLYAKPADMIARKPDAACFTSNTYAAGYRRAEYITGQRQIAQRLRAEGIPYAVQSNGAEFKAGAHVYDDPASPIKGPGTACKDDDVSFGTGCENDDVRWINAHASFVYFDVNCASCEAGLDAMLAAKKIPYAKVYESKAAGGCE